MTEQDLPTVYRAYIDCLNRQDWANLGQFVQDDVVHNGRRVGLGGYREMLERDYVAAGGSLSDIQNAPRNIGTEALHGFLMYRASQPNPVDLIGAMWIIEGLGQKMANDWAAQIDKTTGGDGSYTRFMRYHGANDDDHMQKLYQLIDRLCQSPAQLSSIVRTARVTARLYCLQLEEVEHDY